MKKVVLHLINSNIFSGLENVACDIIQNTSDIFEHIYVTRNGSIIDTLIEKKVPYEIIEEMSIKEVKRVVKKYDATIIHAHDFTASCIASMSFVKIPIISHLHHNAPWLKKICSKTLLYLLCSIKMKKILTVSDAIENEYIFSKFIKNKIECIGNPISVNKIISKVEEKDYKKRYDICCVGRLTEAKNPLRWLSIVSEVKKQIPNVKAIWVGDGELKEQVISKIKELNLNNNVILAGFQNNPYKYIASSKVYLLTSEWEGFGLSAFEALSLGLPAIVSNVGGLPGIVDNDCGRICNIDREFIEALISNLENVEIYNFNKLMSIKKSKQLDNSNSFYNTIKELYNKIN